MRNEWNASGPLFVSGLLARRKIVPRYSCPPLSRPSSTTSSFFLYTLTVSLPRTDARARYVCSPSILDRRSREYFSPDVCKNDFSNTISYIYIYIVLYTSRFFYLFSDNFAQEVVGKLDKNCPSCTNISYG